MVKARINFLLKICYDDSWSHFRIQNYQIYPIALNLLIELYKRLNILLPDFAQCLTVTNYLCISLRRPFRRIHIYKSRFSPAPRHISIKIG